NFACQITMRESNLDSLENLKSTLRLHRLDPDKVAVVFQYNKRDLVGIEAVEAEVGLEVLEAVEIRLAHGVLRVGDEHHAVGTARSEEHTSELQSLAYLVCRLLLEKKNDKPVYVRNVPDIIEADAE